jgi:two-component system sensor kinase FixL
MKDKDKTQAQLIAELRALRQRNAELEAAEIEQKRAEETLRENEEIFQLFMEYNPIYVFFKDENIRAIQLSKNYEHMLGRPIHELIGKTMNDLFPSELARNMVEDDLRILREGKPIEVVEEFNGRIYTTTKFPIRREGKPPLLAGFTIDITARKRMEEALRETHEFLSNLLEYAPVSIYVTSADGRLRLVNQRWEQDTQKRREDVLGCQLDHVFPLETARKFDADNQRVMQTDTPLVIEEVAGAPVEPHHFLTVKFPLHDVVGRVEAVGGLSVDITERKQAEEEVRRLNAELEVRVQQRTAQLEAMNKELQSFAYVVSHDLKAPLRGISYLADWLAQDYANTFDVQGKEMLSLLNNRVKRMDNLIEGVLQYSRAGRLEGKEEPLDLNHLVREVVDLLTLPEHIHITVEPELPVIVGDTTRLTQVFQNLLGNAVKFMDKPVGEIRIGCVDLGDYWQFQVMDNGPGIDAKYHEKIFQIFQTLGPRDQEESTGIGLAIVKQIVEFYGGKVWVESEVEKGSTFFFTLPKRRM